MQNYFQVWATGPEEQHHGVSNISDHLGTFWRRDTDNPSSAMNAYVPGSE